MGKNIPVGDLSPESAKRRRAAGVKRQQDYKARLAAIGLTATARLSEAALAHKVALAKTQRVKVGGVELWVPVAPKVQTVGEQERRMAPWRLPCPSPPTIAEGRAAAVVSKPTPPEG
jgi:hypothetical protein